MMARSKNVLAVLGMLCVDEEFRAWFFTTPRSAAAYLVGALTEDELRQIDDLGGYSDAQEALQCVYDAL
jgi:hypothetical protein